MSDSFKSMYKYSDITPKEFWLNRRQFVAGSVATLGIASQSLGSTDKEYTLPSFSTSSTYSTDLEPNSLEDITSYNNFYEFGTGKGDPQKNAHNLTTRPWNLQVDGLCNNPQTYSMDELLAKYPLEERIYKLRCVEAWSMIVPWIGFELKGLIQDSQPTGSAKYVAFETLVRPEEMNGQRRGILEWPYREGLRMDEAMHPLTILSVGLYGDIMPKQNGAPIRLVVPWKYGFKSVKSIVKISFTEEMPPTTWNMQNPREYGFYSNVNPQVSHPRWSQASERQVGGGLFASRIPTEMFNGYSQFVADLYKDMDLTVDF